MSKSKVFSSQNSTWKKPIVPRGKYHNKTASKTTVSLYLSKNLVEKARNHRLNLSRVTEQALNSILDYLQTQNDSESSKSFLNERSFQKESSAPVAQPVEQRFRKPQVAGSNPARGSHKIWDFDLAFF